MVRSMTGYGRGDCSFEGLQITVELRAVNNRYLDCAVKLPRAYIFAAKLQILHLLIFLQESEV